MDNGFLFAVDYVLNNEGGLVENSSDPGGITNFGISLRFYRENINAESGGDSIKSLTKEDAIKIYYAHFWNKWYEDIYHQEITDRVLDTAVSCGIATANKILQRSVWGCAGNQKVEDSGILDAKNLSSINYFGTNILYPFRVERAYYYRDLVNKNPDLSKFLAVWLTRAYR